MRLKDQLLVANGPRNGFCRLHRLDLVRQDHFSGAAQLGLDAGMVDKEHRGNEVEFIGIELPGR
jgi:hypothetical protein